MHICEPFTYICMFKQFLIVGVDQYYFYNRLVMLGLGSLLVVSYIKMRVILNLRISFHSFALIDILCT